MILKKDYKKKQNSTFKSKTTGYLSVLGIATASTFGAINTANAVDLADNDIFADGISQATGSITDPSGDMDIDLKGFALTYTAIDDVSAGVITDSGANDGTDASLIISNTNGVGASTHTIETIIVDGSVSVTAINAEDDVIINIDVVAANDVGGALNLTNNDDTANKHILVDVAGSLTVDGVTTLTAANGAASGASNTTLIVDGAATFTGGIVLNDDTGKSIVEFEQANAVAIAGDIAGGTAGHGTLQVTGATKTFSGTIGATSLLQVDVDALAIFSGAVSATTINVDADTTITGVITGIVVVDTAASDLTIGNNVVGAVSTSAANNILKYNGTAAQSQTGNITSIADGDGIIQVNNTADLVSFNSLIGATTKNVGSIVSAANSSSIFKGKIFTNLINIDGDVTMSVKDNTVERIDLETTATLVIDDTIEAGDEVFSGMTALVNDDIAGTGNIKMPANLTHGESIVLLAQLTDNADAAIKVDVDLALFDTALRNYTTSFVVAANNNDLVVTANDNSTADVAKNLGISTNEATSLLKLGVAVQGDAVALDALQNSLNSEAGLTPADATALSKQASPQTEIISGSTFASKAITGSVQGIMSNRMASLRSGDAFATGMSAGGAMSAKSGFVQVFGTTAEQKNTSSKAQGQISGFDADSSGVAIGFDGISDSGTTVGLSLSMANTEVDSKGTGKATNAIDTYTASIYMDKATDSGYIEGSLTYGISENETSRKITSAGLNRTLTGTYDSYQVSAKVGAGMPNDVGNGFVTPFASFTGTFIDTDSYTERSNVTNDSLRLKISQEEVTSMLGSIGVKYHNVLDNGGVPMISLAVNNEFGDSQIKSNNIYQGTGATTFKTTTDVEELSATLGLGYAFTSGTTSLNIGYEANANDDKYISHGGSIKLVGKF
jgi:uncharacterized protein with beta-barrel porin domain